MQGLGSGEICRLLWFSANFALYTGNGHRSDNGGTTLCD